MKNSALLFWVSVALVGSAAYGSWLAWRSLHSESWRPTTSIPQANYRTAPPPGPRMKEFQLVERSGKEFDSKELKGHVWIGSFFFATCPGPCWQLNQALKGVYDDFKDTDLELVSITCDPKNDSPEALRRYADRFQADPKRWLFLTGDLDYVMRVGRDVFHQNVQPEQHRNSALVIDRNGKIRGSFDLLDPAKVAELKVLVKQLLAEKPTDDADAASDDADTTASAAEVQPHEKP